MPANSSVAFLYAVFFILTAAAFGLAKWIKSRSAIAIQSSLLSPMGSLYIFTTAFLLSNVIFQMNNLRTAVTQEVVTLNKLGAVMFVLPPEQRIEGRRLLYDYTKSIAEDEAKSMKRGERNDITQEAIDRLRDFLSSPEAALPSSAPTTPESANYLRKANDFGFDLVDARERRLSLSSQGNPLRLWLAIGVMYFALTLLSYLVHNGKWTTVWLTAILLMSAPIPAVMLFIYSNPIAYGLFDMTSPFRAVLARSI
ncbi:MAG: DUF4239 domain-containing protein [Vulcanococcus sp.]|uniref:bestrophin-like domain n=1 Tax=Vulcanococcus sp. TaxID=2856995 RepID=UPI0025CE1B40|nr:DUF4239 domain-containing protein [Vulcanococcus sp.]MBW0166920.1 DUF4239 domain-containing protein [Vulcanococcus sp.]